MLKTISSKQLASFKFLSYLLEWREEKNKLDYWVSDAAADNKQEWEIGQLQSTSTASEVINWKFLVCKYVSSLLKQ